MDNNQEAFLLELMADFKIEAAEHQQAIINGILMLEKKPSSPEYEDLIETTFREMHSLKGAARAINHTGIERLCQSMEDIFHQLKEGKLFLVPSSFDVLYRATDALSLMLSEIDATNKSIGTNTLSQLIAGLDRIRQAPVIQEKMSFPVLPPVESATFVKPVNEVTAAKDTVRISTSKLAALLRQAEEFITVKARMGYYIKEIRKHGNTELLLLGKEMEQFHRSMSRMVDDLLLDIKTTLLHPFSALLSIVPKIVRDLSHEYNKEIQLSIRGGETEIDRRILEEMKDPLIHLVRNCIDHGIETGEVRMQHGKPAVGALEITVRQESGQNVELRICDDGAGIDRSRVIESAVKQGIVAPETAGKMTDSEVFALIFRSGISTSPFITDISGRGLGLAIVFEKISKLGGSIVIESRQDVGTTFIITLPVTLAAFRGILVRVSEQFFIIPTNSVEKAIRIRSKDISTLESKKMIRERGENIALVWLGDILGIAGKTIMKNEEHAFPVLILSLVNVRIAFVIDEVLGEYEVLVKSMGPKILHVKNISGVTVLGSGKVVPILHIPEVMESAIHNVAGISEMGTSDETESAETPRQMILVVEDSITSRALLRNIIESSGYKVKTAVNGMEAFGFMQNERFDLVVSDVEMPAMNGFELTAKIRNDPALSDIPVVLVTALESARDLQNGMEAGANAYITKGSFEQSKLLETIQRLI